jgi:hypothetical protein
MTPSSRYPGGRAGERGEAANAEVVLRWFLSQWRRSLYRASYSVGFSEPRVAA